MVGEGVSSHGRFADAAEGGNRGEMGVSGGVPERLFFRGETVVAGATAGAGGVCGGRLLFPGVAVAVAGWWGRREETRRRVDALRTLSVGNESMPMCKFICVTGWDACCQSLTGPLECNVNVGNGAFREKVIVKQSGEKGSVDWKKYLDDIVLVYLCLFIRMVSR